jgi:hypothetical protein
MRSFVLVATIAALTAASVSGCRRHDRPAPLRKEPSAASAPIADHPVVPVSPVEP